MGGNKKRQETPSVATKFRAKDRRRRSLSQDPTDSGSESNVSDSMESPSIPLTKEDLRKMLQETSDDIKAYTTATLEKQIAGLKEDMEALASRTSHTENPLLETQSRTDTHDWDIDTLKVLYLEDGLEDLTTDPEGKTNE
ncbi:Hypothetical predicted protein [Pelobates cultripes]|uniref:Uncharacterized protein n=1 Tax=Pelobates cultripes TaxID=61616 RepID=A0AAD1RY99_PELCU|nr:Hypothetical predicted protein [Pelobates cultripes]